MRTIPFAIILLIFFSCREKRDHHDSNVPTSLQESNKSSGSLKKRAPQNLLDELYYELADKDSMLTQIENQLSHLNAEEYDSTKTFNSFDSKNNSYYSSAEKYIEALKDSALTTKLRAIIQASINNYQTLKSTQSNLLKEITNKRLQIAELHTAMKIMTTLPTIEKYQKDKIPSATSMLNYDKYLDSLIKVLKSRLN